MKSLVTDQRRVVWVAAVMLACSMLASPAHAQVCGDADGSGSVTVTDGVQILRAAAGLSTLCTTARCDVDENGAVSVTDGVNVLRAAAGLEAPLRCADVTSGITQFVTEVRDAGGAAAPLKDEAAPVPESPMPAVFDVLGSAVPVPGGSNTLTIVYAADVEQPQAVSNDNPSLIVAVQRGDGTFLGGFYELPLPATRGNVIITIRFAPTLSAAAFSLAFATRGQGGISPFKVVPQAPGASQSDCQPFAADCAPGQLPSGELLDGYFTAGGGRACSDRTELIPLDGPQGFGAVRINFGTSPFGGDFGFNALDSNGEALVLTIPIPKDSAIVNADGSIVVESDAQPSTGASGACGNVRGGGARSSLRGIHHRLVVRKVCSVGEPVVGSFEAELQLTDGSICEIHGEFLFFRVQ